MYILVTKSNFKQCAEAVESGSLINQIAVYKVKVCVWCCVPPSPVLLKLVRGGVMVSTESVLRNVVAS